MLTFCLILPPPLGGQIMFYSFPYHQHRPEGLKHPHGMTGRLELGYQSLVGLPGVESVCLCVCLCLGECVKGKLSGGVRGVAGSVLSKSAIFMPITVKSECPIMT